MRGSGAPGAPAANRRPIKPAEQPTDRLDFVLVLEVPQHQQVRSVGREAVADAFDRQHQVVVEPEPSPVPRPSGRGSRVGSRVASGPRSRSLDERTLVGRHHQHRRAASTLPTDVGGEHRHRLVALVQQRSRCPAIRGPSSVREGTPVSRSPGTRSSSSSKLRPTNLVRLPAEEGRGVVVPGLDHAVPGEPGHGDAGVALGVTGWRRPSGGRLLVDRPVEAQPHPLGPGACSRHPRPRPGRR